MEKLTAALAVLNARLADGDLYAQARADELRDLTRQRKTLEGELASAEAQWLEAAAALEAAATTADGP